MAEVSSLGPATFCTQANALLRKNLTFQKRNIGTNIRLISFPFLLCLLLVVIQTLVNNEMDKAESKCGCKCTATNADGKCSNKVCGIDYSTLDQVGSCSILRPPEWAPVLQVPDPNANILVTGNNPTFGGSLASNLFPSSFNLNNSDMMASLSSMVLGSPTYPENSILLEPAFVSDFPLYYIQSQCSPNSNLSLPFQIASTDIQKELTCVQGREVWLNSSSDIIGELYKDYKGGNSGSKTNECIAAYNFLNSNEKHFNVTIWYNSSFKDDSASTSLLRVPRSVNLASNAYLQVLKGPGTKLLFDFVKAMPKHETQDRIDISSIIGTLFFTWVILQLFPVVLTSLVYEKQQNLRIMMKMHGLGDGPYWLISYFYFLLMSSMYMLCFVIFGSVIGLKFFTLNGYTVQLVFYFMYINLQISMAFLVAAVFSNVKTATVVAYICVFGTGLLGGFLFQPFIQDTSFPCGWIIFMELYPGFSLYRGLYEFAQYSFSGTAMGTDGMGWVDLRDDENGMMKVLIIMFVEWLIVISVAYHIDQAILSGRSPLSLLRKNRKKPLSTQNLNLQRQGSGVLVEMDKADVSQEREKVEQLLLEPKSSYAFICDNLKKVYPGKDGNPEKVAVKGLSLALPRGECFGMLGPNGAGKTSFISMMIGLTKPTSGAAFVQGLDIRTDMDRIYTSMGVCPQHDLLWETLTGREHLLFYGRLKNLKGAALTQAVDESLKSVNLFHGKVADKQAGKYSGGMKRRLSVAISLIGDPKVVYMDEPSTGLDPASRNNLWSVVTRAKKDRAIILTTHSMEEADVLCDRLGIFVDGSLECIGNAKELKARYGGSYVFTMTTASNHELEVENLVRSLSLNAYRIYQISGTQKFELPKKDVRIADVFRAVENAKRRFSVHAWGLTDTTLEDVFIKVARNADAFTILS